MPCEVCVQKAVADAGKCEFPPIDSATDKAQLKLHCGGIVFLDGKKLKPLRTAERVAIEDLDLCLSWPDGPSMRLRFPDAGSLEPFSAAVEQAQRRAKSENSTPARATSVPAQTTMTSKRHPIRDLATPAKRRATTRSTNLIISDQKVSKAEESCPEEDVVLPPRVDLDLSEEERLQRRDQAAQSAQARAEEAQSRGIGDLAVAQRMQARAERDELVGRIKARYALQGKELPWNLGVQSIEELQALLR
eukprot:TRINITY_DN111485_c0_g1_i1.p1 TRINITY_DN111485_c0_g1~~TRINITY_DN111485_c0_g1_i1.p1  ORF type:complete len:248 (-),score=56.41 TRINITY_DN111485_c0_g1_i1:35-778(-)